MLEAIILGVVQGVTEFLPISSSGHLTIVPWLLGWEQSSLLFDTVLHWGTLVAIFVVFWQDFQAMISAAVRSLYTRSLSDPYARMAWLIVLASVPAAVLGLLFKDFFETLFASPRAAGFFLLVTAGLLYGSEQIKHLRKFRTLEELNIPDAVVIGFAQALALAPGVSRSGSTIAAGLVRRLHREDAARFSFFLGTPVFFGAGLLQISEAFAGDSALLAAAAPALLVGFVVSAITGVLAIRFLLAYLRENNLYIFAGYCLILGLIVIGLTFLRA